ncbi:Oligopeptide transport system permease protein AppB [Geodia barretti]|uniref:Oligopeptide transport system permease protein AppB n=1 Tax=Geodia barretti TaxID=519541 RepID=A0AA35S9P1_GEOBA|nr:Oligopeptide transport system permease protein AppB [Geodia barretti]
MNVLPGDPLVAMFGFEGFAKLSPHDRQRIMEQLGFADPLWKQYAHWMQDIFMGNLGESFFKGEPVMQKITRHGPLTAEIAILSVIISWAVGLPVGAIGAMKRKNEKQKKKKKQEKRNKKKKKKAQHKRLDYAGRLFTTLFLAVPSFWLGLLVVLALLLLFDWKAPIQVVHIWDNPRENLEIVWGDRP